MLQGMRSETFGDLRVWPVEVETDEGQHFEQVLIEMWRPAPLLCHPAAGLTPQITIESVIAAKESSQRLPAEIAARAWDLRSTKDLTRLILTFRDGSRCLVSYGLVPEFLALPAGLAWTDLRDMEQVDPDTGGYVHLPDIPGTRDSSPIVHCPCTPPDGLPPGSQVQS